MLMIITKSKEGGTLTYHNDCYITDMKLVKGADAVNEGWEEFAVFRAVLSS